MNINTIGLDIAKIFFYIIGLGLRETALSRPRKVPDKYDAETMVLVGLGYVI